MLHGGALGDLILTLRLALEVARDGLCILSRVDPGLPPGGAPPLDRRSLEGLELHRLLTAPAAAMSAPGTTDVLRALIRERFVLNALGTDAEPLHAALVSLGARRVFSIDPRDTGAAGACVAERHITAEWRRALQAQGLLFPVCTQRRRVDHDVGLVARPLAPMAPLDSIAALDRFAASGRYQTPEAFRAAGRIVWESAGAAPPYIAIHPGSGGMTKCWAPGAFITVAEHLRRRGCAVRFFVGPAELERWPAAQLQALRAAAPLHAFEAPAELTLWLAGADAYLGNDSGPTHLAAFLGVPTVALFGPTTATRWAPPSGVVRAAQGDPQLGATWGLDAGAVVAWVHALLPSS